MWLVPLILIAALSGFLAFILDPVGSILNVLRVGSFLLAALTGGLLFFFNAPFDTFGGLFLISTAIWVLLLFVPQPRAGY